MRRTFIICPVIAFLALFLAAGGATAATECPTKARAPQSEPAATGYLRLSEGSNRGCAENCVAQCREAQRSCSGDAAACRAAFQICARRCVVSCDASK